MSQSSCSVCPVEAVWRELLGKTFSVLGRIACVANCRDEQTGCYRHNTLVLELGVQEADHAMRVAHEFLWRSWIGGSLGQQQTDLLLYLQDVTKDVELLMALWLNTRPFSVFRPPLHWNRNELSFSRI